MRFLLGVLVGYSVRGKQTRLIRFLVALAIVFDIVLPAVALLALRLDVEHERRSRPAQTRVPLLKGLSYESAYDCGYYDQSHFINDFKEFSSYNPKVFFNGQAEGSEYLDC